MKNEKPIDYRMAKKMFDSILATRATESEKKMNPYEYVMKVVNDEFGLRGTVKHIGVFDYD